MGLICSRDHASEILMKIMLYVFLASSFVVVAGCGRKHGEDRKAVEQVVQAKVASAEELIGQSHCLSCHLPTNQMGLPAWRDVAEKYVGDKKAENFLVSKIGQGGSGSWGNMDMPPYFELSEPERRVIVRWILASDTTKPVAKNAVKQRNVSTKKK